MLHAKTTQTEQGKVGKHVPFYRKFYRSFWHTVVAEDPLLFLYKSLLSPV